ncbi:hypothetical protein ANCCAN_06077 [Ancylostoma caninum]|uniref:Uncharacterized protein n=1 Tax=Ancylostoma caninum TaxID=29170 RepID=A0A368GU46_ANCCA|nr:hypothetical protein ANCCAN_06077 [Ancylostoma caninum]
MEPGRWSPGEVLRRPQTAVPVRGFNPLITMSRVSLLLAALLLTASSAYLSDSWMLSSERPTGPRCVPIPHNLTICYGMQVYYMAKAKSISWHRHYEAIIDPEREVTPARSDPKAAFRYSQMRLPNLLEHETINEAIHQSSDWKSLLQLNCHPDTQVGRKPKNFGTPEQVLERVMA